DFTPVSGTLTFAPGQTSLSVSVPVLHNGSVTPNAAFSLVLSSPVNATLGKAIGTATILSAGSTGGTTGTLQPDQFEPNDTSDVATFFGSLVGTQAFTGLSILNNP